MRVSIAENECDKLWGISDEIPDYSILDSAYYKNRDYYIPNLSDINYYGYNWDMVQGGVSDLGRELLGFKYAGKVPGFKSKYYHGLRIIQHLWSQNDVTIYREKNGIFIPNNYFLRAFKRCCENDRLALAGCASSGKSFAASVYALISFYSNPQDTTVLISTTSGGAAERRVWGEIKSLHNKARWKVGSIIDYLKCITFEPNKEILESKKRGGGRDLRNGIIMVPIPKGAEGENALATIIGTKNENIIWIIDEMTEMIPGIRRPMSNLASNIKNQLIGIGNSKSKLDPHGEFCEPLLGWDSINQSFEGWETKTGWCEFFHGEASPNFHPSCKYIYDIEDFPFPRLSNRIMMDTIAIENASKNDVEQGRKTIDYMRFAVGFWAAEDTSLTILSPGKIKEKSADKRVFNETYKPKRKIAGFDAGFTRGGDKNKLAIGDITQIYGDIPGSTRDILILPENCHTISPRADSDKSYKKLVAEEVVRICRQEGVEAKDFYCDAYADGGEMLKYLIAEWNSTEIHALSSTEKPRNDERYYDKVTEFWYQVADGIQADVIKGFNISSDYSADFFARHYESSGRGQVRAEKKADMKIRVKRSPDAGDSVAYMVEGAVRSGLDISLNKKVGEKKKLPPRLRPRGMQDENKGLVQVEHKEAIGSNY